MQAIVSVCEFVQVSAYAHVRVHVYTSKCVCVCECMLYGVQEISILTENSIVEKIQWKKCSKLKKLNSKWQSEYYYTIYQFPPFEQLSNSSFVYFRLFWAVINFDFFHNCMDLLIIQKLWDGSWSHFQTVIITKLSIYSQCSTKFEIVV